MLSVLDANLAALGVSNPGVASQVLTALPRADLAWVETPGGALSATVTEWSLVGTTVRALASKRDPIQEARRLAESVDVVETPVVVVTGFGLGHHVAELARRLGRTGVLVVFEPDVDLLRSVLERIDCSEWIAQTNLLVLTDGEDEGAMANALRGLEGVIAMGVRVLEHPASKPRLGDLAGAFLQRFTKLVKAARTTVVTTMVQTEATLRNLTQNIDVYATCEGVGSLQGTMSGRPAIVVSAGPSLQRNIELLERPEVAEKFVIIAVQTVLKPLLARGIKPHFVTALDFHEISRRFYEGLKAEDVAGVTLVVEPKVNPAVPAAFPGEVRCTGDTFLDRILGPEFTRPMGSLPPGATVAHLAYYLARHMGCDPVILMGQDLGFTDGQYYAAGAAIHDVWAGELNEFNTLEKLEWERIVRMKGLLRREKDVLGRPIYTDEQMCTYLMQFQRDFKGDHDKGLTTIDATEGGVAKSHTIVKTLGAALDELGARPLAKLERHAAQGIEPQERRRIMDRVVKRLKTVRQDVWRIAKESRATSTLLLEMRAHHEDQARVNRLIGDVEAARDRVLKMQPAFSMVEMLNQTGVFNRARADRRLHLKNNAGSLSPMEVQREQIERDIVNLEWLGDAAEALGEMLDESIGMCEGRARRTRIPAREDSPEGGVGGVKASVKAGGPVRAVIALNPTTNGLGAARDAAAAVHGGRNALQMTLARLAQCRKLDGASVICPDVELARRLVGAGPRGLRIECVAGDPTNDAWDATILRAGRLWAADCWRGGLGNLTCYDEVLWPRAMATELERTGAAAALVVGAEWGLVDPALCDAVIERYQEAPLANRVAFSQAGPGLSGCVVDRAMLAQIGERRAAVGAFASIGGLLGYVPTAPAMDFVAKTMCVNVPAGVRDQLRRCTLDTPDQARSVLEALASAGADPLKATAEEVAGAMSAEPAGGQATASCAKHVVFRAIGADGTLMTFETIRAIGASLGAWAGSSTATLTGPASLEGGIGPDVLDHPDWESLVRAARDAGIGAIQVRTTLRCEPEAVGRLAACGAEVISADLIAEDAGTYRRIIGVDAFARVRANFQALMAARGAPGAGGIGSPWVVPRITRRDATYEQIENFFDYWVLMAGAAAIDPLPRAVGGERIAPLPLPALARRRRERTRLVIAPDGAREA